MTSIKRLLIEKRVLATGVLFILLSLLLVLVSSTSYTVERSFRLEIGIERGLVDTLEHILGVEGVVETINTSLYIVNMCDENVSIGVIIPPPQNTSIHKTLAPGEELRVSEATLNTWIIAEARENCSVVLGGEVVYRQYPYAWLNFVSFILVMTGSLILFRYMTYSLRRHIESRT